MIWAEFVPYTAIVPEPVRWFWRAVSVGEIPWLWTHERGAVHGQYVADPGEVPYILCPDDIARAEWAVRLLIGAHKV